MDEKVRDAVLRLAGTLPHGLVSARHAFSSHLTCVFRLAIAQPLARKSRLAKKCLSHMSRCCDIAVLAHELLAIRRQGLQHRVCVCAVWSRDIRGLELSF